MIGAWLSGMLLLKHRDNPTEDLTPLDLVTQVTTGIIPILGLKDSCKPPKEMQKTEQITDLLREYKDIMTAIVVDKFVSSDESMFNFLRLVYGTFQSSLEEYKKQRNLDKWDIFFVYKGGNVLRIIANDFTRELPGLASKKINRRYEKFFKRSDADFSIYVRPTLVDYDKIYSELITLSFYLQIKIRQEIMANPHKYFEFCKYNSEYQESILKEFFDKITNSAALKDPGNASFYNKKFDGIVFGSASYPLNLQKTYVGLGDSGIQSKDERTNILYYINNEYNKLYISANETLDFTAGTNRIKFALIRTKICFDCYFDGKLVQIGGELIDVSIPHRLDSNVEHFFKHTDYVNQYQLEFQFDEKLVFYSYTLKYLISDLEYILFQFTPLPWDTPKYEKRLNRLFYMYFIDMFIYMKGLDNKKTLITNLKSVFGQNIQTPADIQSAIVSYKNLTTNDRLALSKLPKELMRICAIMLSNPNVVDITKYVDMMRTLIENCDFILSAFEGIDNFCSAEGNINMKILYNNDFSSLIGGKI